MSDVFVMRAGPDGVSRAYCTACGNGNGPTIEALAKACANNPICRQYRPLAQGADIVGGSTGSLQVGQAIIEEPTDG